MAATLNMHKVFAGSEGYLDALRVSEDETQTLREAREEIRDVLRHAFRDWESHLRRTELFESWVTANSGQQPKLPAPKFRIQGSFAYHTANDCQVNPPQQIDQDDGVFLPVGFLTAGAGMRPAIVSKAYFTLVEKALRPLCERRGWALNPDKLRDTCVRVQISPRLHIDLPLYAIRDDAFQRLIETARAELRGRGLMNDVSAEIELADTVYRGLSTSEIMLAHRTEGWWESDPRRLEDWFNNAISLYGDQVRRVSRAFKGLRDARFPKSHLSSICLMAAVVSAYERVGPLEANRDDLALMSVARELVSIFGQPVENPVFPGQADKCLCAGWSAAEREAIRRTFQDAADQLEAAITGTLNRSVALGRVQAVFGPRVPDDLDLISTVGLASVIRQEPPEPLPEPMPPRTKSG